MKGRKMDYTGEDIIFTSPQDLTRAQKEAWQKGFRAGYQAAADSAARLVVIAARLADQGVYPADLRPTPNRAGGNRPTV